MRTSFFSDISLSWKGRWLALAAFVGALTGASLSSQAQATNLLVNGDFENGVYSSTMGGSTNNSVPVGWTANFGFDSEPSNNLVQYHGTSACCFAESGTYFMYIGQENGVTSTLSQSFSDVAGASYAVSFWAYDMGTGGGYYSPIDFLNVSVGSNPGVTLYGSQAVQTSYSEYTFSFVGTGSDTLTISAQDDYCCFVADNFSVSGVAAGSAAPEPSTWIMLTLGFAGLGFTGYRQRRATWTA